MDRPRNPIIPLTLLFSLILCLCPPLFALAREKTDNLDEVVFIPQWMPQAQFAGFYMAEEKGFFRERGLAVRILEGGPAMAPSELLADGRADFGTMFLSRALQVRGQGREVVNLAQLVQRSSLMLVARRSGGITRPADLEGRRVGLWGDEFQVQPRAFFRKYALRVEPVDQGTTVNLFLRGGVDVASAMWYNEYHLLLNAGLDPEELTTFFFFDHDLNFPEDGIYCLASTLADRPEVARRFVSAALEGWRYAFAHPEETVEVVLRRAEAAKVPTNRAHQHWMLARMQDIMLPPESAGRFGVLRPEDYERVGRALREAGLLDDFPAHEDFFRDVGGGEK